MVSALLVLFVASLGFAQLLVNARQARVPRFVVSIQPPKGMVDPDPGYASLYGAVVEAAGAVYGRPRRFVGLSYEWELNASQEMQLAEAEKRFLAVLGADPKEDLQIAARVALLGARPALHLEAPYGAGDKQVFLLARMVFLPRRIVAICYSGPGEITDADRAIFNAACNTNVKITQVAQTQRK
jgi:hypothetical protein